MKLLLSLSLRLRLPLSHSTLLPGNGLCNNCHHHIAFHPPNHPSIWFMHPSICLAIHLVHLSIRPSLCPSICASGPSIHPSVHLSVHPSVRHPSLCPSALPPCLPPFSQQHLHSPFPDDPWFPEARFGLWLTSHSSPTPYLGDGDSL